MHRFDMIVNLSVHKESDPMTTPHVIIPIPERKKQCIGLHQYHRISLISHASKIRLKIIKRRIEDKID